MKTEDIVSTSRMMVNRLMDNVKHYYTNTFADNIVYVKRYGKRFEKLRSSRNLSTFVDEDLYLLKQYLHGNTCSLERIAKDVLKETKRGKHVSWLDFMMFYSTSEETCIAVEFHYSSEDVELKYHICWPVIGHLEEKNGEKKHDLNEHLIPPSLRSQGYTVQDIIDSL